MLRLRFLWILPVAAALLGGCHSSAALGDAGADVTLFRLGSGRYVVSGVLDTTNDQCNLKEFSMGAIYDLVLDNTTGHASLATAGAGMACAGNFGCGTISDNSGTLTYDNMLTFGTCIPHDVVNTVLTLIGDSTFKLSVTHTQSARCNNLTPDPCTSIFDVTLERTVSGT